MPRLSKAVLLLVSLIPLFVQAADYQFYGLINVTGEWVSERDESYTALENNSSRLGLRGSETLTEGLEAIYQLEYGVRVDDSQTFSQRNIFIGVKGEYGSVVAGHFDTPLKRTKYQVDVFGNMRGDIKNLISRSELRRSNSVMYVSPAIKGFTGYGAYIASEQPDERDAQSLAAAYQQQGFYLALAHDRHVTESGSSAWRAVAHQELNQWRLGLLVEQYQGAETAAEWGGVVSVLYKIDAAWRVKAQLGRSDIQAQGGRTASLGAEYWYSPKFMWHGFYTHNTIDQPDTAGAALDLDASFLAFGAKLRF